MKKAYFDYGLLQWTLEKPCSSLENINFRYIERYFQSKEKMFVITLHLRDIFKEIIQQRKVDMHTFIGNSGGYIGLFCGKYEVWVRIICFKQSILILSSMWLMFDLILLYHILFIGVAIVQLPDFLSYLLRIWDERYKAYTTSNLGNDMDKN